MEASIEDKSSALKSSGNSSKIEGSMPLRIRMLLSYPQVLPAFESEI